MSYLGNSPGVASQRVVTTFTATEGQTNFVPQSGYTLGYLDVYRNGIKLINGVDYTADNGTDVILTYGAAVDDSVETISFTPRGLSDGYTKAEADSRYEPIDTTYTKAESDSKYLLNTTDSFVGTLSVDGSTTISDQLGIGGTPPVTPYTNSDDLVINNAGAAGITIVSADANSQNIYFASQSNAANARIEAYNGAGSEYLQFHVGASNNSILHINETATRLAGSQDTPHTLTTGGAIAVRHPLNLFSAARQDNEVAIFNRTGTPGDVVSIREDGVHKGALGVNGRIYLSNNASDSIMVGDNGLLPKDGNGNAASGIMNLGGENDKWKQGWFSGNISAPSLSNNYGDVSLSSQSASHDLMLQSARNIRLWVGSGETHRFTSDGKVGINSTNPLYTLQVNGDTAVVGTAPTVHFVRSSDNESIIRQIYNVDDGVFYTYARNKHISFSTTDNNPTNPQLYLDGSTKNTGVGTSSPFAKLAVTGSSGAVNDQGIFQITDGTGANTDTKLVMGVVDSSYGWIQSVKPGTNVFNLLLNPNGGNVGIGHPLPSAGLHIKSQGRNFTQHVFYDGYESDNGLGGSADSIVGSKVGERTHTLILESSSTPGIDVGASIGFRARSSDPSATLGDVTYAAIVGAKENAIVDNPDSTYNDQSLGYLGFYTSSGYSFSPHYGTRNYERMRLTSSGDLGINTSSPSAKLHVVGNARVDGNINIKGGSNTNKFNNLIWERNDSTTAFAKIGFADPTLANSTFIIDSSGNGNAMGFVTNDDPFYFFQNGTTTGTPSMMITGGGNGSVGIGTGAPNAKLDVRGVVKYGNGSTSTGALSYGASGLVTLEGSSADTSVAIKPSGTGGVVLGPANYVPLSGSSSPDFRVAVYDGIAIGTDAYTYGYIGNNGSPGNVLIRSNAYPANLGSQPTVSIQAGTSGGGLRTHVTFDSVSAVFNEDESDIDFRVASGTNANALFIDAGSSSVLFHKNSTDDTIGGVNFEGPGSAEAYAFTHTEGGNDVGWSMLINRQNSYGTVLQFRQSNTGTGSVYTSTTGVIYNTTSDRRLKNNISTITDGKEKLLAMNPVTHTWINDPAAPTVHGFIAQEMQKVVPEAVSGDPDGETMMSMDYGRITPVIVAALQDALKEIEELKTRIVQLEAK